MKRSVFHPGLTLSHTAFDGACAICGQPARMKVIDRALDLPIGQCCLEVSIVAAVHLHRAEIAEPSANLIKTNPL